MMSPTSYIDDNRHFSSNLPSNREFLNSPSVAPIYSPNPLGIDSAATSLPAHEILRASNDPTGGGTLYGEIYQHQMDVLHHIQQ